MGKIKLVASLIVCFALLSPTTAKVSAEEIDLTLARGVYYMITSPVLPEDPDPQVSLQNYLGPYDKTRWRFFRYDPELVDYAELKSVNWDPLKHDFDFGRGYWIISSNTRTIDIQGDPVGALNWITLTSGGNGWNQIGNIYLQDFTIGMYPNCNLWVVPVNADPLREPLHQLNDPLNPYTNVTLQGYAPDSPDPYNPYTDIGVAPGDMLEARKAYWLKNIYWKDVILSFDPAGLPSVSTTNATNFPGQDFFIRVAQQEDPPDPPPAIEGSSSVSLSGSSGSGSVGCFIATAAYGDYDHPNVQLLRGFRDRYLLTNSLGRMFVDMYYRYSPTMARLTVNHKPMKALIRFNLMPLIGTSILAVKMNMYGFIIAIIASGFLFLGSFVFLKKGVWGRCKPRSSTKSKEGKRKR